MSRRDTRNRPPIHVVPEPAAPTMSATGAPYMIPQDGRRAITAPAPAAAATPGHPHPDADIEAGLAALGTAAKAFARIGLGAHVIERVRQGVDVGRRLGMTADAPPEATSLDGEGLR